MTDILKELTDEHEQLLALIENKEILKILDLVERVHHPKEEEYLFPLLAQHPLLKQGGPRCMYFRGLDLELGIYASATQLLKTYYKNGGPPSEQPKELPWLLDNNPLSMPIYEHRLGHELACAIRYLMKQPCSIENARQLESFCQEYCRLLKLHIEKEETCLFILAKKILPRQVSA